MTPAEKAREAKIRRRAMRRSGLVLRRSNRRDSGAPDFGVYWLGTTYHYSGEEKFRAMTEGLSLDEIEAFLDEHEQATR